MANYTTRMSFSLPGEAKARLKRLAEAQDMSLSELIRRATSVDRLRTNDDTP